MLSTALGISGSIIATATIGYLEVAYPCRRSDGDHDFVSKHGGSRADQRELRLFRGGLSAAAIQFGAFAALRLVDTRTATETGLYVLMLIAAAALIGVAIFPYDLTGSWKQKAHAASAIAFFSASVAAAFGFAATNPTLPRLVATAILAPLAASLFAVAVRGAKHGLSLYYERIDANRSLREIEGLAAVVCGANYLLIAMPLG